MLSLCILVVKYSYQHGFPKKNLSEMRTDLFQDVFKLKRQHKIESDEESQVRLENLAVRSGIKNEVDMILEDLENEP
jgi:trans-2-enoyl-CoA reductase